MMHHDLLRTADELIEKDQPISGPSPLDPVLNMGEATAAAIMVLITIVTFLAIASL